MIILSSRLLKKSSKRESNIIEARPVNAGLYMAFKHRFSFATDFVANFGCNRSRVMPDIVSKLLRADV